jgi:hypothetical protein
MNRGAHKLPPPIQEKKTQTTNEYLNFEVIGQGTALGLTHGNSVGYEPWDGSIEKETKFIGNHNSSPQLGGLPIVRKG